MIVPFSIDSTISEKVNKDIPQSLIKKREGGQGKMLSYVSGYVVIRLLNEITNYMWDWSIDKYWIEEIDVFDTAKDGKPAKPKKICHCLGTLTLYFKDDANDSYHEVRKQAFGSKACVGGVSNYENVYKIASTDALKKAASLFGIASELYLDDAENEYFKEVTWTPSDLKTYGKELTFIKDFKESQGLDEEGFNEIVRYWSNGKSLSFTTVKPEQIPSLASFIQKEMSEVAN